MINKKYYLVAMVCIFVFVLIGCGKNVRVTTGFDKDVIYKISNKECKLSEILLVLANEKNKYEASIGSGIWDITNEGIGMEENVKSLVKKQMTELETISLFAEYKGIELSREEENAIKVLAETYFATLSEEEIELLSVSVDDVINLYTKFLLSEKVYNYVSKNVSVEVSDEEARVIKVMYILKKDYAEAQSLLEQVNSGTDFYSLAQKNSEDTNLIYEFGRGQVYEEFENAAFSLIANENSQIVETQNGYYIIKCVEDYIVDKTQQNKEAIIEEYKNKFFLKEYEPFLEKQTLIFNNKVWDEISIKDYEKVKTDSLYSIYENGR